MATIILPLLIILVAFGGILILVGRRLSRIRESVTAQEKEYDDPHEEIKLEPKQRVLHLPQESRIFAAWLAITNGVRKIYESLKPFSLHVASAILSAGKSAWVFIVTKVRLRRRKEEWVEPILEEVNDETSDEEEEKETEKEEPETPAPETSKELKPTAKVEQVPTSPIKISRKVKARKMPVQEAREKIPSLIEEGKTKEAEEELVEILSKNPRDIDAYRMLGILYLKEKDFPQAIEVFEEALRRDPKHEGIHGPLGDCYIAQGEYSKALSMYQRAHEEDGENIAYLEGLLYIATRMDRVPLVNVISEKILALDSGHEEAKKALERIRQRV